MTLPPEAAAWADDYVAALKAVAGADALRLLAKLKLVAAMGNARTARLPDGRVVRRSRRRVLAPAKWAWTFTVGKE